MKTYICRICGYRYEETKGDMAHGIEPGTKWEDLPSDWVCPICGAEKSDFEPLDQSPKEEAPQQMHHDTSDLKALNALEISAICSNLARGCEKQYMPDEAAAFLKLADFYKVGAPKKQGTFSDLVATVQRDLDTAFPKAVQAAKEQSDRGAQRALVWSEKVTRILSGLLSRYEKEGDSMLERTNVYVCTICGFIYIGNDKPDICPVCKVPAFKIDLVEGR